MTNLRRPETARPSSSSFIIPHSSLIISSYLEWVRICQVPRALAAALLLRGEAVRGAEVVAPGGVYEADTHLGRARLEEADVGHAVEQVARLASLHLPVFEHVVVEQVVEAVLLDAQAARVGGALEDFDVGRR